MRPLDPLKLLREPPRPNGWRLGGYPKCILSHQTTFISEILSCACRNWILEEKDGWTDGGSGRCGSWNRCFDMWIFAVYVPKRIDKAAKISENPIPSLKWMHFCLLCLETKIIKELECNDLFLISFFKSLNIWVKLPKMSKWIKVHKSHL